MPPLGPVGTLAELVPNGGQNWRRPYGDFDLYRRAVTGIHRLHDLFLQRLVQTDGDRAIFQALPDELRVIDIRSL